MSRFWNQKTNAIEPYVAGEQPGEGQKVIKLNTNENPYPPSPNIGALLKTFDEERLRLYPDTSCTALREAFAEFYGVRPTQVFCGNGSDEVLAFAFRAFFESGPEAPPLLTPDISYSFYPVYAELFDIPLKKIPLRDDFSIAPEDYFSQEGGVAIANPNAPTGLALPVESIRRILDANPDRVVLIDEAYACFGGPSCIGLLSEYPNLLIIGTLSKSHSLAGLRLGYAVARPRIAEAIRKATTPFAVSHVAQLAGLASLRAKDELIARVDTIVAERAQMLHGLRAAGLPVLDSEANFVWLPLGEATSRFAADAAAAGVVVRPFAGDGARISVGEPDATDSLLELARTWT